MTGFLEESDGVRSMTRLVILMLTCLTGAVVVTTCVYLLKTKQPDSAIILAMAGLLTPLVVKGAVAIINRNAGDDSK